MHLFRMHPARTARPFLQTADIRYDSASRYHYHSSRLRFPSQRKPRPYRHAPLRRYGCCPWRSYLCCRWRHYHCCPWRPRVFRLPQSPPRSRTPSTSHLATSSLPRRTRRLLLSLPPLLQLLPLLPLPFLFRLLLHCLPRPIATTTANATAILTGVSRRCHGSETNTTNASKLSTWRLNKR